MDAIKQELSRVRQQKRDAQEALVRLAQERGFFTEEEETDEDSDFGLSDRRIRMTGAIQRQEAIHWGNHWLRIKEWDLLGDGTPRPASLEKTHQKFMSLDEGLKESAKEWGDELFSKKHPGFAKDDRLPKFPAALILACWSNE